MRDQTVFEDVLVRVPVTRMVGRLQISMPICRALLLQQWLDEWIMIALLWLHEQMTSRLEFMVDLLGPDTCAGIDVDYVASLVCLQVLSDVT